MTNEYVNITIRSVAEDALRELKAEAAREKKKLGQAASEAFIYWAHHRKLHQKKKSRFTDLKPVHFGSGTKHSSTDIDKVLYG